MVITVYKEPGKLPARIEIEQNQQQTLLQLLQEAQIYIDAPCNGNGNCGKCLVQYTKGAPKATIREIEKISEKDCGLGWRLACLSVPKEDCEVCLSIEKQEKIAVETGFLAADKREQGKKQAEDSRNDVCVNTAYGVALDIGSTTLAAALICMSDGETHQTAVRVNHQRAYGADVISRIKAANEGKAAALQNSIREDIQALVQELLAKEKIQKEQLKHLAIAGNTTMCHLLAGYSCETLGKAPFTPVDISLQKKSWKEIFGNEEYRADVRLLPGISAFVGADIVAGIYSTRMYEKENTLLIDIGTNGEMAVHGNGQLFVTSVAAGPALEGGNISCGMAGIPGAVSHAALYGRERMVVSTIGKQQPEGLCGTGIIDVVYELCKHRLIDENGLLASAHFEQGYPVVKDKIFFTQDDIRQVQMAKAAIRAGIELLLRHVGISMEQVTQVFVAGGFGFALDFEKAIGIGMLPAAFRKKVTAVGNSALEGAKRILIEPDAEKIMQQIAENAGEINLAMQKEFQETYVTYMQFRNAPEEC